MESHKSYCEVLERVPDFRVRYQFLPQNTTTSFPLYQGSRFDFRYPNDGDLKNSNYIIWPEFEDEGGFTILDKWLPIDTSGTAKMWIVNQNLINYHRQYIKLGTVGYMTSGSNDIAKCEVIELINLQLVVSPSH
jgi:hypothetical protein